MNNIDAIDKANLRLEKLREYLVILQSLKGVTGKELQEDVDKRAKAERFLQLASEACIDICELVISDQRFQIPQNGREAIEILGREHVLDLEFSRKFASVASFRNILVHDYMEINYNEVADKINNHLGDFDIFAKSVAQFLK